MKKIVALMAVVFGVSALAGCKAEVDPDGNVSSAFVAPR